MTTGGHGAEGDVRRGGVRGPAGVVVTRVRLLFSGAIVVDLGGSSSVLGGKNVSRL